MGDVMQLSQNFGLEEFIHPGTVVPGNVLFRLQAICQTILEPLRLHYNRPVHITSGYRTPEQNQAAGGVPDSYHTFTADKGAVDFRVEGTPIQGVFDWIRLESPLPFDKVILERRRGASGDDGACIHLQVNDNPRKLAYLGETHGTGHYIQVDSIGVKES
jgi:zinc D-Ala-D-Ala carboxypeptidase